MTDAVVLRAMWFSFGMLANTGIVTAAVMLTT